MALSLTAGLDGAQTPPVDLLMQAPLTPGVVARLFEHIARPDVHARIGEALHDADPGVRAAAARVMFMSGDRGRALALAEALAAETAIDPLVEMSRALTHLGDVSHDALLFAAWERLGTNGAWKAAVAYGLARGPSALAAIPRLHAIDPGAQPLAAMVRAARPDRATLAELAAKARTAGDAAVYGAALSAARALKVALDDAAVVAGLESGVPDIRLLAAIHVLTSWRKTATPAPPVAAALHDVEPLGPDGDALALLARELAQRAGGRAAATSAAWTALVNDPSPQLVGLLRLPAAHGLLTEQERRRIARRLDNTDLDRREADVEADAAGPGSVRLADGYPTGFMASVFAATGCELRRIGQDAIAAATVAFVPDGRTGRAATIDTGLNNAACREAFRVALRTLVTDDSEVAGGQRVVVLPFELDLQQCLDGQDHAAPWSSVTGLAELTPPRKTRHRNPNYPASALQQGVQGAVRLAAVIGTKGCLQPVQVIRSVDPRLDIAALRSVFGWRFAPPEVEGRAVPFPITIEVTFSIRR